jgi:hypothetical protein
VRPVNIILQAAHKANPLFRLRPGLRVKGKDSVVYLTVGEGGRTLKRLVPKIRGKAARKADKLARRLAKEAKK